MFKKLLMITGVLGLIYVIVTAVFYLLQEKMIHFPTSNIDTTPDQHRFTYEDVILTIDSKNELHGWFVPHSAPRYTILFFHGNAGNISHRIDSIRIFNDLGLSVFIYDYRGYGKSRGKRTENVMYEDAERAWNFLTETKNIPPEKIIVFGRSLGTAMASWIAAQREPAGLIMESGFTSLVDMGRAMYRWLPTQYLLRWKYDSLSRISNIQCPILFVHSSDDRLIPHEFSKKLFAEATAEKKFLEIHGDHNEGFLESGSVYTNGLQDFIDGLVR